jgi:transposase-like protein
MGPRREFSNIYMSDFNNRISLIKRIMNIQETMQERINDTMNWFRSQIREVLDTQFQDLNHGGEPVKKPRLETPALPNGVRQADLSSSSNADSTQDVLVLGPPQPKPKQLPTVRTPAKKVLPSSKSAMNALDLAASLEVSDKRSKDTLKMVNGKIHKTTPELSQSLNKLSLPPKPSLNEQKNEEIKSRAVRLYRMNVIPRIIGRLFDIKGYWAIHVWGNFEQFPANTANKLRSERDRSIQMQNSGYSPEEIAKDLNIKGLRVKYYLGLLPDMSRFFSLEYRLAACKEVLAGADYREVCDKYEILICDLKDWVKEYSEHNTIKMSTFDFIKSDGQYDGAVIRKVLEEYLVTSNIEEVAKKYNIRPQARIIRWIKCFNDSLYLKENTSNIEESPSKPSKPSKPSERLPTSSSQSLDSPEDSQALVISPPAVQRVQKASKASVQKIPKASKVPEAQIVSEALIVPEVQIISETLTPPEAKMVLESPESLQDASLAIPTPSPIEIPGSLLPPSSSNKSEMTKAFLSNLKETYSKLISRREDK